MLNVLQVNIRDSANPKISRSGVRVSVQMTIFCLSPVVKLDNDSEIETIQY